MEAKCGVCGAICSGCPFLGKGCAGCIECEGKVFWALQYFGGACPLYVCAVDQRGYSNCGECPELPCKLFLEQKDPSMSDEEHQESITKRVNHLKNIGAN